MLLAALHAVEKVYGEQVVLADATLELRDGDRVALIGRNGSGKSTILELLAGLEEPDGGRVFTAEDVTLAHLEQDPRFDEAETVVEVAARAFAELDAMEARLSALEAAGLDDPERFQRWEHLHATFERRGGYARRARRDAVLSALGFAGRHDQPVRQLSGGERTRLGLAQLLMAQPDVLLLDEPTNHLDVEMRQWLEGHLARYPGAALIVSHDRAFLDGAASRTAEVSRGRLRVGPGNPSAFRAARAEAERLQAMQRANEEKERDRLQAATDQMKRWAGQNAKLHRRAKAMQKRVERFEAEMVEEVERGERTLRFAFDADESGAIVLTGEHLTKRFDGRTLFEAVSFELRQGDRVALVGPNGAGKSTLLKMIIGQLPSDDPLGQVRTGARVRLGYYDQELRGVNGQNTLFEELLQRMGDVEAHNALGRFLFPYEAQFKRIDDLSGGERARLSLLDLTLGRYNLLVLDEPTNHLDVEMIAALEAALQAYEGTLLFVSHDRRFLEALAERVWEVRDGRFEAYEGDWGYYQRHARRAGVGGAEAATGQNGRSTPGEAATVALPARRGPSRWQLERRLEALEEEIGAAEARLDELSGQLAAPDALDASLVAELVGGADGPPPTQAEVLAALGAKHARLEAELLQLMEEWHDITERLSAA
ncbi:MAG: ABC-F family ATP-binding cassette domain-containing protein [Deinococcales bacterium]|nr:ABC-F family ATP-binding cassette domain-containing protein [Deinococcales bacterium]